MEVLAENEIDLIVTDVRMPVMNGISLLKEVKAKQGHKSHVIFITGSPILRHAKPMTSVLRRFWRNHSNSATC